jgi:hypothetical protein
MRSRQGNRARRGGSGSLAGDVLLSQEQQVAAKQAGQQSKTWWQWITGR